MGLGGQKSQNLVNVDCEGPLNQIKFFLGILVLTRGNINVSVAFYLMMNWNLDNLPDNNVHTFYKVHIF